MDNRTRIRELNDVFRTTFTGGRVLLTAGVNELDESAKAAVLEKVRTFIGFDSGKDPHREHDFVSVEHEGTTYFGKLDYYAPDMQSGSEDPSDPAQTVRVLTVMRADEY